MCMTAVSRLPTRATVMKQCRWVCSAGLRRICAVKYRNGDTIPANLNDIEWSSTVTGAVAIYGEGSTTCTSDSPDIDACVPSQSLQEYGRLYNWYAVVDDRSLCPAGWHVPENVKWWAMTDWVGSWDSNVATHLKANFGWYYGGNGTNASGFSGLPGGNRHHSGNGFQQGGNTGYWWTSTPNDEGNAWSRYLTWIDDQLIGTGAAGNGYSIRCLKDSEEQPGVFLSLKYRGGL